MIQTFPTLNAFKLSYLNYIYVLIIYIYDVY
jgi:hypothetical protein